MTFNPLSEPVDFIELAGQRSPGVAVVQNAARDSDIQERRGYGFGGAFAIFRGYKVIAFSVVFTLTTEEQWEEWHEFYPLIRRAPQGRRARALDIVHPILADLGVTSVLVKKVNQPLPADDGGWSITIDFVEYRRPQRALARPDGSTAEERTPGEREIARLSNENQRLASQRDTLAANLTL